MEKIPERRLEFNKDGTDFYYYDLHVKPNQKRTWIITKDSITSIQYDKMTVRKLFKKVDSEVITIVSKLRFEPFTVYKYDEPKYYEEYKEAIRAFAKKNMLTLRDNTK